LNHERRALKRGFTNHINRRQFMAENEKGERVWPSGLTMGEAEELHKYMIDGTRVFFFISVFAHLLAYMYSPWLH
jgi:light-harvesting protein B-800-850 beta chain